MKNTTKVLVTGAAGFIGYHTAKKLMQDGISVIGIDSFVPYYDPLLKQKRSDNLTRSSLFTLYTHQIEDAQSVKEIIEKEEITHIIHLAAQAGVRHSLKDPWSYLRSNIDGFLSILEACRALPHIRTVWASSSSVYGTNQKVPFAEEDRTDCPANLYGATKKSNEAMAYAYHHLFGIQLIGLRFFTVYGPWGRPDMAYYSFADKMVKGEEIVLFGKEELKRDFTYIDDIVAGITQALFSTDVKYGIYNLGGSQPQSVLSLVSSLEKHLGVKAKIAYADRPKGDIEVTYAETAHAFRDFGFQAAVPLDEGIKRFSEWYREYHNFK